MLDASRAEIELVAIAMYESHCRSYANYGTSVDDKVKSWLRFPGWSYLSAEERHKFRAEAYQMLKEKP